MIPTNHLVADEQDAGKQGAGEQGSGPSQDPDTGPDTGPNTSSDSGPDRGPAPTNPDNAHAQTAGSKEAQRT